MSEPRTYHNPVQRGFFPDPSVIRVGDDYYMVIPASSIFRQFPFPIPGIWCTGISSAMPSRTRNGWTSVTSGIPTESGHRISNMWTENTISM